jgi:hypothetical protein
MARTTDENDEQPTHGVEQLSQEDFDNEVEKGIAVMLTQEESQMKEDEDDDEDDDGDDDSSEDGYVTPEDPFPSPPRQRPTEDDLDEDFNLNDEVGIKP